MVVNVVVICHVTKKPRYVVLVNAVDAISFHYAPPPPLCSRTMSESEWDRPLLLFLPSPLLFLFSPGLLDGPASAALRLLRFGYCIQDTSTHKPVQYAGSSRPMYSQLLVRISAPHANCRTVLPAGAQEIFPASECADQRRWIDDADEEAAAAEERFWDDLEYDARLRAQIFAVDVREYADGNE